MTHPWRGKLSTKKAPGGVWRGWAWGTGVRTGESRALGATSDGLAFPCKEEARHSGFVYRRSKPLKMSSQQFTPNANVFAPTLAMTIARRDMNGIRASKSSVPPTLQKIQPGSPLAVQITKGLGSFPCLNSGCGNELPRTQWLVSQRKAFLTVLRLEVQGDQVSGSSDPSSGSDGWNLSVPSCGRGRMREPPGPSHEDSPLPEGSTLVTS